MTKKVQFVMTLSGLCLGLSLLFNYSVAEVDTPAKTPPVKDSVAEVDTPAKTPPVSEEVAPKAAPAPDDKAKSSPKPVLPKKPQLLGKMPLLEKTVAEYVTAWQKEDFKAMRPVENWEGGDALGETKYIQNFKADFKIETWKITKIEKAKGKDEYKVLVLISHNMPKHIVALVSKGKNTVNSTLVQWWKKEGDKFVHLFHIERDRIMSPFTSPPADSKSKPTT